MQVPSVNKTIGPYDIVSQLGAGGMGEVYRARDTRLDRQVAIKMLPASFANDEERLRRFEQEARATSALNHANILTIYDIGSHEGSPYIVSELLEGEELREQLKDGSLTTRKAIDYAQQITQGLSAAHEKGITHRDLKPENIFITNDGRVKILDFGLAKLKAAASGPGAGSDVATQKAITDPGVILGTVGYMSPEQVRGQEADHRSDIFSFGSILYEMLSGRRAFQGETTAETMTAILKQEPEELTEANAKTNPAIEKILRRCLEKKPERRFQSTSDLSFALEALSSPSGPRLEPSTVLPSATESPRRWRPVSNARLAWAVAAALVVVAAIAFVIALLLRAPTDVRVSRVSILPPEKATFRAVAVSPDGRRLAFGVADASGKTQLWVRSLDSLTAQALSGTDGAEWPFWSPDSRFIGFSAQNKLKKIAAIGGPAQTLCNAPDFLGGTWNSGDVIIFSPGISDALYRVSAAGGEPSPLTSLDQSRGEESHRWPQFLPDGRHFIYFALSVRTEDQGIYTGSLDSKETKRLMSASGAAIYSPPGYLLFARETTLMALPFDPERPQLISDPFPVAEHLAPGLRAFEIYCSASDTGVLGYLSAEIARMQPVWVDRAGKQLGTIGPPGSYFHLSLSPDEKQVAFDSRDSEGNVDIWITDLARATRSRFTFDPSFDLDPVWSPDGRSILFTSNREGAFNLYLKPASGAGAEEPVLKTDTYKRPSDWSRDGQFVLYESLGQKTSWDLWVLPLFGDRKPFPFVQTEATELHGHFSPDGHWIAYTANEAGGTNQVYVKGFPASGGKWQISRDGGAQPRWRRDGKELFYISADSKVMAVDVKADSSTFRAGVPRALFDVHTWPAAPAAFDHFAVSGDGQKVLINSSVEERASSPATVVFNWAADLKR